MNLQHLINEVATTVAALPILAGVAVIAEDKGDVENKLKIAIGKTRLAVVVGWDGFKPRKQGRGDAVFGETTVLACVFEKPSVNRGKDPERTALSIARQIALALQATACEGMTAPLYLKQIGNIENYPTGEISVMVEFSTTIEL